MKVFTRGPDDLVYSKHQDIREMIPRGVTIMQLNGRVSQFDVVIHGNKKFSGGIGDEDECQPENNDKWREYCLGNPDTAIKVVCMKKLNGEAAHFSGRYIDGRFYLFVGSKNVHMLIRDCMDIEKYEGSRYGVAKIIARAVCSVLNDLEKKKQHLVFSLLHHTKSTAFCEILQPEHQHLVNISHLSEPQLNVISFTSTASYDGEVRSLTAMPPHHALDLAAVLGFQSNTYKIIPRDEVLTHKDMIRQYFDDEGEVLYFLTENEDTIGLAKVKSVWYILLRALREKAVYCFTTAKKKSGWSLQERINATHKRLREIQRWLKLSDDYIHFWSKLCDGFLRWTEQEIKYARIEGSSIRPKFPILWKQYLCETKQTDRREVSY
ncbi:uncharacterized protein LOC121861515 isoform X2 [Homarus americanus]|nr:uncharacterized protein LOC121861515 isoform X2 [Homarus americanus]XP_042215282.1 uncharacterized protein LOC121861515 isoform X2 [Homarus americanus]